MSPTVRVVVCLGGFAWQALWPVLARAGYPAPRPRPSFTHGAEVEVQGDGGTLLVLGCFHPSQQNTFTGKLTVPMIDAVFARAVELAATASR